jgi:hypothetical protein
MAVSLDHVNSIFTYPARFSDCRAFWTNGELGVVAGSMSCSCFAGPNWPADGEIDIVEGVNDYTNDQSTIHTNPGCSMPSSNSSALSISGTVVGSTDCSAADTDNEGCGVRASQNNSFGAAFNLNGGGVYASAFPNFLQRVGPHVC